jgi:tRNA pseudouridine(55) synthase
MNVVILAYKYRTETMAICMDRIRCEAVIPAEVKITYAGRLDPMAEGLVLFLCGDMCYQKDQFLRLDKQYRVQFFLGYETDTHDILGIIKRNQTPFTDEIIMQTIEFFQKPGTFTQQFPDYSSRKVLGKPLFVYAKNNSVDTIPKQSHNVNLYRYENFKKIVMGKDDFIFKVMNDVSQVIGDFRQNEIAQSWQQVADSFSNQITIYEVSMTVSSGFYIRQWVRYLELIWIK